MTGEASSVNLDRSVVRRKAMDLLARREYSCGELTQKLLARWPDYGALIQTVVTELQQDGLLSDERFIDMFIHASARKGRGPLRIVTELRQKGIDELIAKRSVNESEIDW
ncbi:MAG: regulatory protein RecX, partial [bacterium]